MIAHIHLAQPLTDLGRVLQVRPGPRPRLPRPCSHVSVHDPGNAPRGQRGPDRVSLVPAARS